MNDAIADLRAVIEHAIVNHPRTLQTELGPSDIGIGCDRCLTHLLAGHAKRDTSTPWLPTIGHAVHDWMEATVLRHMGDTGSARYLPEATVTVGQVRGRDITGHTDLYDIDTGTVIDYKITGVTTLKKVSGGDPTTTYRNQIHLYARGIAALGYDVRDVTIWFLPRNTISIDGGHVHAEPYDPAIAEQALTRANAIASGVDALGADAVLAQMPPHSGAEFTCTQWAEDPSAQQVADVARQTAGLIA